MTTTTRKLAEFEKVRQDIFAKTGQLHEPVDSFEMEIMFGKLLRRIVGRHQAELRSTERAEFKAAAMIGDSSAMAQIAHDVEAIISFELPDFLNDLNLLDQEVDFLKFKKFFNQQVPEYIIVNRDLNLITSLIDMVNGCPLFLKEQK